MATLNGISEGSRELLKQNSLQICSRLNWVPVLWFADYKEFYILAIEHGNFLSLEIALINFQNFIHCLQRSYYLISTIARIVNIFIFYHLGDNMSGRLFWTTALDQILC